MPGFEGRWRSSGTRYTIVPRRRQHHIKFQNTLQIVLYDLLKPGVAILSIVHIGPHVRPRTQEELHADSCSHLHTQLSSLQYPILQILVPSEALNSYSCFPAWLEHCSTFGLTSRCHTQKKYPQRVSLGRVGCCPLISSSTEPHGCYPTPDNSCLLHFARFYNYA